MSWVSSCGNSVSLPSARLLPFWHKVVTRAAAGPEPELFYGLIPLLEIDEWVQARSISHPLYYLVEDNDFARMERDDQRTMLLIATEALYGPNRDAELLRAAVEYAEAA